MIKSLWRYPDRNVNFSADQNSTSPKVQGLISLVRLLKMFQLFKVLFIATKIICLQNIELKYQKLSLFWEARNRFSALPILIIIIIIVIIIIVIIIIEIIIIIIIQSPKAAITSDIAYMLVVLPQLLFFA